MSQVPVDKVPKAILQQIDESKRKTVSSKSIDSISANVDSMKTFSILHQSLIDETDVEEESDSEDDNDEYKCYICYETFLKETTLSWHRNFSHHWG